MSQPYRFTPVNFDMTTQRQVTTGQAQADAGSGQRTAANRARSKGNTAQPLIGPTHTTTNFELVNNMTAALLSGNAMAATALVYLGSHATQSVATGMLAAQARGR